MKLRQLLAGLLAAALIIPTGGSLSVDAADVVDDGTGWEIDLSEGSSSSDDGTGGDLEIPQEGYSVFAFEESVSSGFPTDAIKAVNIGGVIFTNGLKIAGIDIGYDEGSYFTKNGKSCWNTYWAADKYGRQRCHKHDVCEDATHAECNCMRYWPSRSNMQVDLLASQCLGFARFCQWKVYGYHDGDKSGSFSNLGSLSSGNCTASKVKNLLYGCGAATHVRMNSGHSISIINYTENNVEWTDCNNDGYCVVRHRTSTWSEFATILKGYDGVSYANSGNKKPNGTISEHIHNYNETGTEAAHPHKEYKKCSCGVFYYTGNTSYRSNCSECNGTSGCTCSTSYAGQYIVSTSNAPLTIRSGHGTSYTAVGSIPKGTEVTVTKANGSWAHITYNGVSGCVSMEYLKGKYIPDNLYPTPINCYPLSDAQHAADAYDSVGGTHIGYIYGSDFCTIKEIYSNGWCLVNCPWSGYSNGRNVYAYTGAFIYLESVNGKVEQLIAENTSDTYRRAGSGDWLGASRSWVDAGDTILKVGVSGDRTQIVYPNGVETHSMGWIPSSALVHTHTPGAAATCTLPQVCTKCDAVIAAALGHKPGAAATCTSAQTCTRCGTTINSALGHSYDAQTYYEIVHPHKIYKVCTRCGVTQYTGGTTTYDDCTTCFPVATGVTLNKSSTTLNIGENVQLTATVTPSNATNKDVTWSTSDNKVAVVDADGLVTAYNTGTATITAKTVDGGKTATCKVTVSYTESEITGPVKTASLNGHTYAIYTGKVAWTTAKKWCETHGGHLMTVTSAEEQSIIEQINSNEQLLFIGGYLDESNTWRWVTEEAFDFTAWSIVTDKSSLYVGIQPDGSFNGTEYYLGTYPIQWSDYRLFVPAVSGFIMETEPVPVTGVTLNKDTAEIKIGEALQLEATVLPDNATDKGVKWSSSNTSVATVSTAGLVTAKAAGTATITVTTNDGGKTASCVVTCVDPVPVTGVRLDKSSVTVKLGETFELTATVSPSDAANQRLSWSYSGDILEIQSFAGSTPKKVIFETKNTGTGYVTVKTEDGGYSAKCAVTVLPENNPVIGVSLNKTAADLRVGNTLQLTATITPSDATDKTVTWSSNNTAAATVSNSGLVTAKSAGTATITVTTNDGGKTASCVVTCIANPDEYADPTYTWTKSGDGYTVTAAAECTTDASKTVTETVTAKGKQTEAPTCEAKGTMTYTATFTNDMFTTQTKKVDIPAKGHAYELKDWTWAADYSTAAANFVCANDASHVQSVNANITAATAGGKTTYTASAAFGGRTYTDTKTVEASEEVPGAEILKISSASGRTGNTVTLTVSLTEASLMKSLMLYDFSYDKSALKLTGGKWLIKGQIEDWNEIDGAVITFAEDTELTGDLFELTFEIVGSKSGEYAVSCLAALNVSGGYGKDDITVPVSVKTGTVSVNLFRRGDVNGDGGVNSNDAIHLLRHTMNSDRYPINQSGDMNGDGKVDSNDAIYLLRHTMSPERYPLKG